jgi:hypothetical protein
VLIIGFAKPEHDSLRAGLYRALRFAHGFDQQADVFTSMRQYKSIYGPDFWPRPCSYLMTGIERFEA